MVFNFEFSSSLFPQKVSTVEIACYQSTAEIHSQKLNVTPVDKSTIFNFAGILFHVILV